MRRIGIILAAGKGTRMRSKRSKVTHEVCGRPMLDWAIEGVRSSGFDEIYVVTGHCADEVEALVGARGICVRQTEQLGTGHAVQVAMAQIAAEGAGTVLVTCGDTPLLRPESLAAFLNAHEETGHVVDVMTTHLDVPTGYGRIVRKDDRVAAIVEEKDASETEKAITEINVGTYLFDLAFLKSTLGELTCENAQGEFYLTDLIGIAGKKGLGAGGYVLEDSNESLGVNNRLQLAAAEAIMRLRINRGWMLAGVTVLDPDHTYIGADVTLGADVLLEAGVILEGNSAVGEGSIIGHGSRLIDAQIGEDCHVKHSVLWDVQVGDRVNIGPFAYLRPGTVLADDVKIGDFVEVKKSHVGTGSKIPHLSYVGDSEIGAAVNVGCGTITCNYDGVNKHRTLIEDGAFIGSNTNLVAPVTIGAGATIGAGTTVRKNVDADALAFSNPPLKVRENWKKDK